MLDDRKVRILQAIIEDYIESGEPVGSKTVAIKYGIGLSSATIRNEMMLLEEMGYITQPHTSAGRIPSERGYRMYVDELLTNGSVSRADRTLIDGMVEQGLVSIEDFLHRLSSVLANVSGYTVLSCEKSSNPVTIQAVRILRVEDRAAAVLVIDEEENVYSEIIRVDPADSVLYAPLSEYLTNKYARKSIRDLENETFEAFISREEIKDGILYKVLRAIHDLDHKNFLPKVFVEGATNLLDHPEFSDVMTIKNLFDLFHDKQMLTSMLLQDMQNRINIRIGSENAVKGFEHVSFISAGYRLGRFADASIGIVGPIRMEYARIIGIMSYLLQAMQKGHDS